MKINITYTTDDYVEKYGKTIRNSKSLQDLISRIEPFKEACDDALKQAKNLTEKDYNDFLKDIKKARYEQDEKWIEKFNERFGDIVMPYKMLIASMAAEQFHCPWGCAFIRLSEMGFPPRK